MSHLTACGILNCVASPRISPHSLCRGNRDREREREERKREREGMRESWRRSVPQKGTDDSPCGQRPSLGLDCAAPSSPSPSEYSLACIFNAAFFNQHPLFFRDGQPQDETAGSERVRVRLGEVEADIRGFCLRTDASDLLLFAPQRTDETETSQLVCLLYFRHPGNTL